MEKGEQTSSLRSNSDQSGRFVSMRQEHSEDENDESLVVDKAKSCIVLDICPLSSELENVAMIRLPELGPGNSFEVVHDTCMHRQHRLPDLPGLASTCLGTPRSKISEGHNVHDASVLYLSRKPLTASFRRPTWQLIYALVASVYCFSFCRVILKSSLSKSAPEIISATSQGQFALALFSAVCVSRRRLPDLGVKIVGCSLLLFGQLFAFAGIWKGFVCKAPVEGMLRYGVVVPQAFTVAYVFLRDQLKWLPSYLFAGICHLVTGMVMYLGGDYLPGEYDYKPVLVYGTVLTLYPMFSISWRYFLLYRAVRALKPFKQLYEDLWRPNKENQRADIVKLTDLVKKQAQDKHLQPDVGFAHLMALATSLHPWFQRVVATWAETLGVEHKPAALKSRERVLEKVERSYQGDVRRVLDLVRASIVVDSVEEVTRALEFVLEQTSVYFIKSRYDLEYDGVATNGYRDVNLQLSFPQLKSTDYEDFVFELQIVMTGFNQIKFEGQHRKYIMCRNLTGL